MKNILISASAVTRYISISAFTSSLVVPKGIMSSAIVLKICAIAVKIKKYPSTIKKKEKKHDKKIVLLAKSKLNSIKIVISKALIDSNISHAVSFLKNNVLKEYDNMKVEIKNSKT